MSIFARWTWSKPATAIQEIVGAAGLTDAPVRVPGRSALAKVLGERRLRVVVEEAGTTPGPQDGEDGEARTLVVVGLGEGAEPVATLLAHAQALVDGSLVVLVDCVAPEDMTRHALNAGLVDLQQRPCGRMVVTSGRVPSLP